MPHLLQNPEVLDKEALNHYWLYFWEEVGFIGMVFMWSNLQYARAVWEKKNNQPNSTKAVMLHQIAHSNLWAIARKKTQNKVWFTQKYQWSFVSPWIQNSTVTLWYDASACTGITVSVLGLSAAFKLETTTAGKASLAQTALSVLQGMMWKTLATIPQGFSCPSTSRICLPRKPCGQLSHKA